MNKLKDAFKDLKNKMSLSFKTNCLNESGELLTCKKEEGLFALAIKELAEDIGQDQLYQFFLEGQIKNRFGGRVQFKLRTNLEEYTKQKAYMAKHPIPPSTTASPYEGHENYAERVRWQKTLNKLSDEQKVKGFNKENGKLIYGILDKGKKVLTIYSPSGIVLASTEVEIENTHRDEKENSGSGIYSISALNENLTLKGQRGVPLSLKLGQRTIECRQVESCTSSSGNARSLIDKYLMPDGPLYILPYDKSNNFEIKNNILNHTTNHISGPYFNTNYSPKGDKAFPIEIDINDPRYQTETAKEFMGALEKEKETIMELYNLDNDEYNDLAHYAFGIMGNESEFGENWRYDVKEAFPMGVALIKDTKRNVIDKTASAYSKAKEKEGLWSGIKAGAKTYFTELIKRDVRILTGQVTDKNNSRGPTQIKTVPKRIEKHYGINKDNISVPKNSAVATMGFLAEAMVELKNRAKKNPDITKENRMDYLHYIYMGSTHEIKNRTATPDKNIYLRQLKEYQKGITIYQQPI